MSLENAVEKGHDEGSNSGGRLQYVTKVANVGSDEVSCHAFTLVYCNPVAQNEDRGVDKRICVSKSTALQNRLIILFH